MYVGEDEGGGDIIVDSVAYAPSTVWRRIAGGLAGVFGAACLD